ncbi:GNAT family N-acetyltransferase [Nonomuraea sp. NPDC050783]|uniref:GNAT family N-acetyltransferase n=1 Tax=Nonomuraea sp. NPDC050783 TaxID=3154634 RepID=UPI0034675B64
MTLSVRPIGPGDRESVSAVLRESWGGTTVVALGRGELVDASVLPGFVAELDGRLAGVVTYGERDGAVEIITIDAVIPGVGAGRALLDAVRAAAAERGAARLWLITTNDNTHALRFYQRYGFDLVALHRHGVERARKLKPSIPAEADGIPIRHELELELVLKAELVPADFAVPRELVTPRFRLEPLGPRHNAADHAAWTGSIEHIRATPGFPDHGWPPVDGMTLEANLADLRRHENDFARRRGFTYTVLDPAGDEVIGCVYIYPSRGGDHDAEVSSWVRADRAELDAPLYEAVTAWLAERWPFARVDYHPR